MIPGHLCWPVHRVATAGLYTDSLHTILTTWSLEDVCDAAMVCDALERAQADARKGAGR